VRPLLQEASREGGDGRVVLIGVAQEKASAWRSWKAKGQEKAAHPHMEWGRQMTHVNHFYFYIWDPEWGPTFWKTNAYAPFPIWLWLNGHEWAKRQMEKAGVAYEALDNGFPSCADPVYLQKRCDQLGTGAVRDFFWRWYGRLPSPFTASDLKAGYVYDLAFRQFEVSDTVIFDRPQAGRAWFEGVIRDHLDIGRPIEAVLQGGPRPAYRAGHLQYPRLRYRAKRTRQELGCSTGCWRFRQPATLRRRGARRDAGSRRGHLSDSDPTVEGPRRSLCFRAAFRRPTCGSGAGGTGGILQPDRGLHESAARGACPRAARGTLQHAPSHV